MSDDVIRARLNALRLMEAFGGDLYIDLTEGIIAACAANVCLSLANEGYCTHEKSGDHLALFTITETGRHFLEGGGVTH